MLLRFFSVWFLCCLFAGCGPEDGAAAWLQDESARPWYRDKSWFKQKPGALDREIRGYLRRANYGGDTNDAIGILVPHAGLSFSGSTAAEAYRRVVIPDRVLLLTPKHHDVGSSPALWDDGPLLIPGHAMFVDHSLTHSLTEFLPDAVSHDPDSWKHADNHPMEMQLPFLSTLNPDTELIPLTFMDDLHHDFEDFDLERINAWGRAIADFVEVQRSKNRPILLVASTDLIHHQPKTLSDVQDRQLMAFVEALDVKGMHRYVIDEGVTICGEIPTAILMSAVRELRGRAQVVKRTTSAERNDDEDSVVGYGSAVFWWE